MSNVYDLQRRDRLLDQASEWIGRLDRGLTIEEQSELEQFLADSDARETFLELAGHWDKMDSLARLSDIMPAVDRPYRRSPWQYAAVVSVFVTVAAGLLLFWGGRVPDGTQTPRLAATVYETAIGEQSSLTLADGSIVKLNTDSRISVTYTGDGRLVVLERGEAHFDVARDPYRPFTVAAGGRLIQALGTQFSVQLSSADIFELIVVEGSVRVKTQSVVQGVGGSAEPPQLLSSGSTVSAGKIAMFEPGNEEISSIESEDIATKLAWRDGSLVFRGETLEWAVSEISRYTGIEFVFLDEDARSKPVGGVYQAGELDEFLDQAKKNVGFDYQRVGKDKVLIGSR